MSFLYVKEDGVDVGIHKEAMMLPSVKDLWNADKIPGGEKPFFNKAIKFIYHQYYNDHPLFKNLAYKERKQRVLELVLNGRESVLKDLETNSRVKLVIQDYLQSIRLFSEKKYMYLLDKIDELSIHLESIPLKIKKKVEKTVPVKYTDDDGNVIEKDIAIKTEIEIDNSKEYYAAIGMIEDILNLEEKIRNKLKKEKADKELSPKSMMDEDKFQYEKK